MNQAFVKEPDGDQVQIDVPELTHSQHPNYITPAGFESLKQRIADLQKEAAALKQDQSIDAKSKLAYVQRDLRYLGERVVRAIVIPPEVKSKTVRFGATVVLADEADNEHTFTLVGEDETDVEAGRISWTSPLAQSLKGKAEGDEVVWPKGQSETPVAIMRISTG